MPIQSTKSRRKPEAMPKKTTRSTNPPAPATASDPMAEAERRIAEARRQNASRLDLARIGLREVPIALLELRHLHTLNLDGNQLRELPDTLCKLNQLEELYLGSNKLQKVPAALGEFADAAGTFSP
jgi:Leucine-rich repeat (LRR) protein